MSIVLCLLSFAVSYYAGRRSLVAGLATTLGIGYFYGITRANVPEIYTYFIFDAGVIGLYSAQLMRRLNSARQFKIRALNPWVELLMAWPVIMFFIPAQDPVIQLVGLRGNIFLLPFLLLGARLEHEERYGLALCLAALNLVAFAFGSAEFFLGIERFFPENEVTTLIYLSRDVAGYSNYRIPSTFANSSSYGGTMAITIPFLAGALFQKHERIWHGPFLTAAIFASLLGVFMAASRLHVVVLAALIIMTCLNIKSKYAHGALWLLILLGVGWVISGQARLQRFMELKNTEMVAERIRGSVNMSFFELVTTYPFGNGLGGGGTSIPYFLQDRIKNPVVMENEYARLALELGVVGLLMWLAFIAWVLSRRSIKQSSPWLLGQKLAKTACVGYFLSGLIGIGLLTSVPQSCLFLLSVGWLAAHQRVEAGDLFTAQFTSVSKLRAEL